MFGNCDDLVDSEKKHLQFYIILSNEVIKLIVKL